MEYSNLFVVLMGIGTVFFGLICLIVLVWVMGKLFRNVDGAGSTAAPAPQTESHRIPSNSGEILAAISAAIAEELGTDVSAFRIVSVKKL